MGIAQAIARIRQELPPQVRLIAVSKQVSPEAMAEAYTAGVRDFGESRLQEALPKQEQLKDLPDICWHFIGHLQTNKAKKILASFNWIHTCDRLELAQLLNQLAGTLPQPPSIGLQVKMLPDPQKYGWTPTELLAALPELDRCTNLHFGGLMTILPLGLTEPEILAAFQSVQELRQRIIEQNWPNLPLPELSMGMSDDYPLAIAAGATMVRLGRVIFGDRG